MAEGGRGPRGSEGTVRRNAGSPLPGFDPSSGGHLRTNLSEPGFPRPDEDMHNTFLLGLLCA